MPVNTLEEQRLSDLTESLVGKLVAYGKYPETSKIRALHDAYQDFARMTNNEFRLSLLRQVSASVLTGQVSCDVFLPFIFADEDLVVISPAALELAQNSPVRGSDCLEGVRAVYDMAVSYSGRPRLGILMGLACMGDRRVYGVLRECWKLLSQSEVHQFTGRAMIGLYAGYVDFLIESLEQDSSGSDDWGTALWGSILGALCGLPSSFDKVVDIRRQIPLDPQQEHQAQLLQSWTIPQYGAQIWPRLERLIPREREPRLIPMVMKAWGIDHPDAASSERGFRRWLREMGNRR